MPVFDPGKSGCHGSGARCGVNDAGGSVTADPGLDSEGTECPEDHPRQVSAGIGEVRR